MRVCRRGRGREEDDARLTPTLAPCRACGCSDVDGRRQWKSKTQPLEPGNPGGREGAGDAIRANWIKLTFGYAGKQR